MNIRYICMNGNYTEVNIENIAFLRLNAGRRDLFLEHFFSHYVRSPTYQSLENCTCWRYIFDISILFILRISCVDHRVNKDVRRERTANQNSCCVFTRLSIIHRKQWEQRAFCWFSVMLRAERLGDLNFHTVQFLCGEIIIEIRTFVRTGEWPNHSQTSIGQMSMVREKMFARNESVRRNTEYV